MGRDDPAAVESDGESTDFDAIPSLAGFRHILADYRKFAKHVWSTISPCPTTFHTLQSTPATSPKRVASTSRFSGGNFVHMDRPTSFRFTPAIRPIPESKAHCKN